MVRHSGAGEYAGVLVILIGLWAIAQSFQRQQSIFSRGKKVGLVLEQCGPVSILLALGRYAPFYQLPYAVPYFSTIRNPIKFMHPFHMSFLILFAYGLEGIARRYLKPTVARTKTVGAQAKGWWASATAFEKRWIMGSFAAVAFCVVGWLVYGNSRPALERYLQYVGFDSSQTTEMAKFSISETGLFVLFLILSVGLLTWILSGAFAGAQCAGRQLRWAFCWLWTWAGPTKHGSFPTTTKKNTRAIPSSISCAKNPTKAASSRCRGCACKARQRNCRVYSSSFTASTGCNIFFPITTSNRSMSVRCHARLRIRLNLKERSPSSVPSASNSSRVTGN